MSLVPFLDSIPELDDATTAQRDDLRAMLDHKGFPVLMGLLMGQQQGLYGMLANVSPATAEGAHQIGVIQGQIKGIAAIRETVLEMCEIQRSDET